MLPLIALLMHIDEVAQLVRTGIASVSAVAAAVQDGRAKVLDANGQEIVTPEALQAGIDRALARWHRAADAAEARIDERAGQ